MLQPFVAATGLLAQLELLRIEHSGAVTHVRLNRPAKRNAISDALIAQLQTTFINLPEATRAVVLSGEGDHFCAELDLLERGMPGARMQYALGDAALAQLREVEAGAEVVTFAAQHDGAGGLGQVDEGGL